MHILVIACVGGSLLKGAADAGFCQGSGRRIDIAVARLDYLLDKVPPYYSFYYLKIDTEGADHLVIDGGGGYTSYIGYIDISLAVLYVIRKIYHKV